jgi:hypothetical protein
MRHRIFSHGKHLQDIAPKSTLHIIEINLANVVAHHLLRGIIDEHVEGAEFLHVLLNGLATCLVIHEISWDEEAFFAFFFD